MLSWAAELAARVMRIRTRTTGIRCGVRRTLCELAPSVEYIVIFSESRIVSLLRCVFWWPVRSHWLFAMWMKEASSRRLTPKLNRLVSDGEIRPPCGVREHSCQSGVLKIEWYRKLGLFMVRYISQVLNQAIWNVHISLRRLAKYNYTQ